MPELCVFCGNPGTMRSTNDVMCDECARNWLPDNDESKPDERDALRLGARVRDLMRGEEWTIMDLYNLARRMREEQPADWIFICRLAETIAGVLNMKESVHE